MAFAEKSKTVYKAVKSKAKPSNTRGPDPFVKESKAPAAGKKNNISNRTDLSSLPTYRSHYVPQPPKNKNLGQNGKLPTASHPQDAVFVWSNSAFGFSHAASTIPDSFLPSKKSHTATITVSPKNSVKADAVATTNPLESRKPSQASRTINISDLPTTGKQSHTSTVKTEGSIGTYKRTDGSLGEKTGATLPASFKTFPEESIIFSAEGSTVNPDSKLTLLRNLSAPKLQANDVVEPPLVTEGSKASDKSEAPPVIIEPTSPVFRFQPQTQVQPPVQAAPRKTGQINNAIVHTNKSEVPYGGDPPSRAPTNWTNNFRNSATLSSNSYVTNNISQLKTTSVSKPVVAKAKAKTNEIEKSKPPIKKSVLGSTVEEFIISTKPRPRPSSANDQTLTEPQQQSIVDSNAPGIVAHEIDSNPPSSGAYYPWGPPPYNEDHLLQPNKPITPTSDNGDNRSISPSPWGRPEDRRDFHYNPRKPQSRWKFSSSSSSSRKSRKSRRKSSQPQDNDNSVMSDSDGTPPKLKEILDSGANSPIKDPKLEVVASTNHGPADSSFVKNNQSHHADQDQSKKSKVIDSEKDRSVWENSVKLIQMDPSRIQSQIQSGLNKKSNNFDHGAQGTKKSKSRPKVAQNIMTNSQLQQQAAKNKVTFSSNAQSHLGVAGQQGLTIPGKTGSSVPYSGEDHSKAPTLSNTLTDFNRVASANPNNQREQRKQSLTSTDPFPDPGNAVGHHSAVDHDNESRIAERQAAALVSRESLIASPRYSDYGAGETNTDSNANREPPTVPSAPPQLILKERSSRNTTDHRKPSSTSHHNQNASNRSEPTSSLPPVTVTPKHIGRGSQFWYRDGPLPGQNGQHPISWYPISFIAENWVSTVYFSDVDVQSAPAFKYPLRVEELHFDGVISQRNFLSLLSRVKDLKTLEVHLSTLHHLNLDVYSVETIDLPKLKSLEISSRAFTQEDTSTYNMSKVIANSILLLNLEYPMLSYLGVSIPYVPALERRLMNAIWQCILHHKKTLLTFNIECAFADNMHGRAPRPYADPAVIEMDISGAMEVHLTSFHMFYWTRLGGTEFWRRFLKTQEKLEYIQFWCEGPVYYKFPYDVIKKNYYQLATLSMNVDVRSYPDRHDKVPIDFSIFNRIPNLKTIALKGFLFDDAAVDKNNPNNHIPIRQLNRPDIINLQNLPRRLETIKIMNLNMDKTDVKRLVLDNSKLRVLYLDNIGTAGSLGMTLDTLVSLLEKPDSVVDKIEIFDSFNRHSLEDRDRDSERGSGSKRSIRGSASRKGINQGYKLIARILLKKESKPSFRAYRTANNDFEIIYEEDEDEPNLVPSEAEPSVRMKARPVEYEENLHHQQKYPDEVSQGGLKYSQNGPQRQVGHGQVQLHPHYQHSQKFTNSHYQNPHPQTNLAPHQNPGQVPGQHHQQHSPVRQQRPNYQQQSQIQPIPQQQQQHYQHTSYNSNSNNNSNSSWNSKRSVGYNNGPAIGHTETLEGPRHQPQHNNQNPQEYRNPNSNSNQQQHHRHAYPPDNYYMGDLKSPPGIMDHPDQNHPEYYHHIDHNKVQSMGGGGGGGAGRRESKSIYIPANPPTSSLRPSQRRKSSSSSGRRRSGR